MKNKNYYNGISYMSYYNKVYMIANLLYYISIMSI